MGFWKVWTVHMRGDRIVDVYWKPDPERRGPEPLREDWPRPQKFSGPATRIRSFVSAASATWSVESGVTCDVPLELAEQLVAAGRARLAPGEPLGRIELAAPKGEAR